MKLSQIEIYSYTLKLHRPFVVGGQPLDKREGLLVRLILPDGRSGVGDVAPLPGVSRENLKKALFQLKELRSFLLDKNLPEDLTVMRTLCLCEPFVSLCPSVRFGFESALVHALSVRAQQHPIQIFQGREREIYTAGLLQGTPDEVAFETQRLLQQGCRIFKLKVGDRNIPLDVKKFYAVYDLIDESHQIRLDVNRSWQLNEAVAFCKNITRNRVEFIEEPVKDPSDLESFTGQSGFPVALDETLWEDGAKKYCALPGVKFLVIKPTMIGGVFASLDWMDYARQNQKACVISSSFESGVGTRMLAALASLTDSDAGLGPSEWFAIDLLGPVRDSNRYIVRSEDVLFQWSDVQPSLMKLV